MPFWNLYSRTACALFGQVLILQRLPRRTRFRSRAVIREFPRDFCSRFRDEFFDGYFETALSRREHLPVEPERPQQDRGKAAISP